MTRDRTLESFLLPPHPECVSSDCKSERLVGHHKLLLDVRHLDGSLDADHDGEPLAHDGQQADGSHIAKHISHSQCGEPLAQYRHQLGG